jgi:hypothetical protein
VLLPAPAPGGLAMQYSQCFHLFTTFLQPVSVL